MAIFRKLKIHKSNQSGLASVVVVSVLVVVLSLIAVGFARDMDRTVQQTANSSLGAAATYAAKSGLSDAIAYLKANPSATAANCNDLLTNTVSAADKSKILANISGDSVTQYTCLLIDPKPTDLVYQKVNSFKSQVVQINPSANLSKMMISWQANDRTNVKFPAAGTSNLLDETAWGTGKTAPLLRVTLYALPTSGGSAALQYLITNSSYKTFFLYPNQAASASASVTEVSWALGDGSMQKVACNNSDSAPLTTNPSSFSGSADYDCNIIINSLPGSAASPFYYFARLTPIYATSDVKVKGVDASNKVQQLINTQAIVDVTAKSGTATKRLQARVDIASSSGPQVNISSLDDAFPEYAIRSSNTFCKQLQILVDPLPGDSRENPLTKTDCSAGNISPIVEQLPPVPATTDASNITTSSATLNGTIITNGADVSNCYFKIGTASHNYNLPNQPCTSRPSAGAGSSAPVHANVSGLNQYTNYYFQLCAANSANAWDGVDSCDSGEKNFRTLPLPPTVTITPPSTGVYVGNQVNLSWSTSPANPGTTCNLGGQWAGYSNASSGSKTDTFNSPGSYTYNAVCTGPGGVVGNTASSTITVTIPPVVINSFDFGGFANRDTQSGSFNYNVTNAVSCYIHLDFHNTVDDSRRSANDPISVVNNRLFTATAGDFHNGDDAWTYLHCDGASGSTSAQSVSRYVYPRYYPVTCSSAINFQNNKVTAYGNCNFATYQYWERSTARLLDGYVGRVCADYPAAQTNTIQFPGVYGTGIGSFTLYGSNPQYSGQAPIGYSVPTSGARCATGSPPSSPPPGPTSPPAGPPAGGGGGGGSPAPPPRCALLHLPIYPNFGFMQYYFGRVICD